MPQQQQRSQSPGLPPSPQNPEQRNLNNSTSSQACGVTSPSSAANQSTTEGKKISCEDIQLVQNLIERCLQLYMNQNEVINTLLSQAKIEPGFTSLVWQKLEEQNPEFFKAYYIRLKLKRHIMTFNHLLEQQVHLMQKMRIIPTKPPMPPLANGLHHSGPMGQVPMGYPVTHMSGMPAPAMPVLPHSPVVSAGNPLAESFHSSHESPGSNSMDQLIMPCTNAGDMTGASGGNTGASFPFGSITDMGLDTSFVSHESNTQNGMVSFGDGGDEHGHSESREGLGGLGHLPRNFSLSDLAAELDAGSDLGALGVYTSPFMSPDTESFLQSPDDKHDIEHDKLSLDDLDFGDLK